MTELYDLEEELRFMEKDKEHRSLKEVLDAILDYKDKKKRKFSEG